MNPGLGPCCNKYDSSRGVLPHSIESPRRTVNRLILQPSGQASSQATEPANLWACLLVTARRAGSAWLETSKTLLQNDKLVALQTAVAATTELLFYFLPLVGAAATPEDCKGVPETRHQSEGHCRFQRATRSSPLKPCCELQPDTSRYETKPTMKAWNGANLRRTLVVPTDEWMPSTRPAEHRSCKMLDELYR